MTTLEYLEMRLREVPFGSPEHILLTEAKADLLASMLAKKENDDV